jgi:hypothetical protein
MKVVCPNINDRYFKEISEIIGLKETIKLWVKTNGKLENINVENLKTSFNKSKLREKILKKKPDLIEVNILDKLEPLYNSNFSVEGRFSDGVIDVLSGNRSNIIFDHELLHAVFQTFLSNEEIGSLLNEVERKLGGKEEVNKLILEKDLDYFPDNIITNQQKRDYLLEDNLAELYSKKSNSLIDRIIQKIKAFINFIFNNKYEIESLFNKIDSNYYKESISKKNIFTNTKITSFALLNKPQKGDIKTSFTAKETTSIVLDTASLYLKLRNNSSYNKYSDDKLLEYVLDIFKNHYKESNKDFYHIYSHLSFKGLKDDKGKFVLDSNGEKILDLNSPVAGERLSLKNMVVEYIQSFNDIYYDSVEEDDDISGREKNNESFDRGNEEKQGWENTPLFLKKYLSTVIDTVDKSIILYKMKVSSDDAFEKNGLFYTEDNKTEALLLDENGDFYRNVYFEKVVDPQQVYFGILRAISNSSNDIERLKRLEVFSYDNPAVSKFFEKWKKDCDIDFEATKTHGKPISNSNGFTLEQGRIYQAIVQGFNKITIDPIIIGINNSNNKIVSYIANKNTAFNISFSKWYSKQKSLFSKLNELDKKEIIKELEIIESIFKNGHKTEGYSDSKKVKTIINAYKLIGIDLSVGYVKYSLLKIKTRTKLNRDSLTIKEQNILSAFQLKNDEIFNYKFHVKVLENLKSGHFNLFEDGENANNNISSRIKKIAKGNGYFDETIFESSYERGDGKKEYIHMDSMYNSRAVLLLKDDDVIQNLIKNGILNYTSIIKDVNGKNIIDSNGKFIYLDDIHKVFREKRRNILLNDNKGSTSDFLLVNDRLYLSKLDSLVKLTNDDNRHDVISDVEDKSKTSLHFSDMGMREFLISLLNMSVSDGSIQNIKVGKNNEKSRNITVTPNFLGLMESSNTAPFVNLPLITGLYENGELTEDKAKGLLGAELTKEMLRISNVFNLVTNDDGGFITNYETLRKKSNLIVDGLHFKYEEKNGVMEFDTSSARGLSISDSMKTFLSKKEMDDLSSLFLTKLKELKEKKIDINDKNSEKIIDEIIKSDDVFNKMKINFNKFLNELIDLMEKENIIKIKDGIYSSKLLSKLLFSKESNDKIPSLSKGFKDNLATIILSSELNIMNYKQLIHGDPASMHKSSADTIKRDKTNNAAGTSIYHNLTIKDKNGNTIIEPFEKANILTIQEEKEFSDLFEGSTIDVADAQMFGNVKMLRQLLFGLFKLDSKTVKEVCEKIEKGIPIDKDTLFDSNGSVISQDRFHNSFKLVYRNGDTTFKISMFLLLPELTSKVSNGERVPIIGMEKLDDMRNRMESTGKYKGLAPIDFIVYQSGSKTLKANTFYKNGNGEFEWDKAIGIDYDTNYLMLQQENPSNKVKITTPTQLQQLIDTDQDDNVKVYFEGENKQMTVGDIKRIYQKLNKDKIENLYVILRNELYNIKDFDLDISDLIRTGKVTPRLSRFHKQAIETLINSGGSTQLVDLFGLTPNGNPKNNLNNPLTIDQYKKLYLSFFTKQIYKLTSPGTSMTLVSGTNIGKLKKVIKIINRGDKQEIVWKVIRSNSSEHDEVLKTKDSLIDFRKKEERDKHNYDRNNFTIKSNSLSVGDYFIEELSYNVPKYDSNNKNIGYFTEFMSANHFPKWDETLDKDIPESISRGFANRIPLQYFNSMMSYEMVDTLPIGYGSSIITNKSIIELSGADFDIDKIYMQFQDVYFNGKDYVKYSKKDDIHNFKEYIIYNYYNNKLFKKVFNSNLKKNNVNIIIKSSTDLIDNKDVLSNLIYTLQQLNYPSNIEEYADVLLKHNRELNNGVINNNLLYTYFSLLTNDGVRDTKMKSKTSQEFLENLYDNNDSLSKKYFFFRDNSIFKKESSYGTNNILTQIKSKKALSVGKDLIGIYVNIEKVASLLFKMNKNFSNGAGFTKFKYKTKDGKTVDIDGTKIDEKNGDIKNHSGEKIFDILGHLISAATDEGKDMNNTKIGLDEISGKFFAAGSILKLDRHTLLSIIHQPIIQEYLKILEKQKRIIQTNEESREFVKNPIIEVYEKFGINRNIEHNDILIDIESFYNYPLLEIELNSENTSNERIDAIKSILDSNEFKTKQSELLTFFIKINDFMDDMLNNLTPIFNQSKGVVDFEKLDLIINNSNKLKKNKYFDFSSAFNNKNENDEFTHDMLSAFIQVSNNFNELSGLNILDRNTIFKKDFDKIFKNFKHFLKYEVKQSMVNDFNSFLHIQLYKSLYDNKYLRSSLLYHNGKDNTIYQLLNEAPDEVKEILNSNSFYNFITVDNSTKVVGKKRIIEKNYDSLSTNSRLKQESYKINELQNSFIELYNNPLTNEYARAIFTYLIVKDGLQFKNKTFIEAIPSELFKDLFNYNNGVTSILQDLFTNSIDRTTLLNELSKKNIISGEERLEYEQIEKNDDLQKILIEKIFGKTKKEIVNHFLDIYSIDINNTNKLIIIKNKNKKGIHLSNDKTTLKIGGKDDYKLKYDYIVSKYGNEESTELEKKQLFDKYIGELNNDEEFKSLRKNEQLEIKQSISYILKPNGYGEYIFPKYISLLNNSKVSVYKLDNFDTFEDVVVLDKEEDVQDVEYEEINESDDEINDNEKQKRNVKLVNKTNTGLSNVGVNAEYKYVRRVGNESINSSLGIDDFIPKSKKDSGIIEFLEVNRASIRNLFIENKKEIDEFRDNHGFFDYTGYDYAEYLLKEYLLKKNLLEENLSDNINKHSLKDFLSYKEHIEYSSKSETLPRSRFVIISNIKDEVEKDIKLRTLLDLRNEQYIKIKESFGVDNIINAVLSIDENAYSEKMIDFIKNLSKFGVIEEKEETIEDGCSNPF